jgi:hypothetical protein
MTSPTVVTISLFRFLDLPTDLRFMVYDFIFTYRHHNLVLHHRRQSTRPPLTLIMPKQIGPIHLTCRLIHGETSRYHDPRISSEILPRVIVNLDRQYESRAYFFRHCTALEHLARLVHLGTSGDDQEVRVEDLGGGACKTTAKKTAFRSCDAEPVARFMNLCNRYSRAPISFGGGLSLRVAVCGVEVCVAELVGGAEVEQAVRRSGYDGVRGWRRAVR